MEKKTPIKDIYKKLNRDLPAVHSQLCKLLGENQPFARFSIGQGFYQWKDTRMDWKPMTNASPSEQETVMDTLLQVRKEVSAKVGEKMAELLFSTPNDSYIYYAVENGNTRILLTGWGFCTPERPVIKPAPTQIGKKNPVDIAFLRRGQRLPDHPFSIQLLRQTKEFKTDASGIFHFDHIPVNEKYTLTDVATGQSFLLHVEMGRNLYEFQLADHLQLNVHVTMDGMPLAGEKVTVDYHGEVHSISTDENGSMELTLPFQEEARLTCRVRDMQQEQLTDREEAYFEFTFETPTPPPAPEVGLPKSAEVKVSVKTDGQPLPNQSVSVTCDGHEFKGTTGLDGCFSLPVTWSENSACTVSVNDCPEQTKRLKENAVNVFEFDRPHTFSPHVVVTRADGTPVPGYAIKVNHQGKTTDHVTDTLGEVKLEDLVPGELITVTDKEHPEHVESYSLDKSQNEYTFVLPEKEKTEVKVMFRDADNRPIECEEVIFQQEGTSPASFTLNHGDLVIHREDFPQKSPVKVNIRGWEKHPDCPPFQFTLQDDENEYLLQEKEKTEGNSLLWEILTALGVITLLLAIWPFLESFCYHMYQNIY